MRAARFDSMVRNFFEMFLRAQRALEFSHSQDPKRTLQDRNSAVHRNLAVSAASPAAATQFGSVPGFSPSAQSQRPAAAGLSRDGSNKATIAAFLAQQARSFEISLLRARKQEKIPDHRLENRETDGGRKEAQFPVVRQAMEKDIMIKDFNVSEKGHGSYWLLGILRWVMVLIFVSFGIQKFTPQSADGIALYISNSPFVSWLSIFGIRGEAYLLGIIELTTAALLAAGAFIPILSALGSLMGLGTFAITWSFFFSTPGVVKWSVSTDPIAWNLTGEFLYKDVVLLCVCIVLFLASLPKKVIPLRSN